MPDIGNLSSTLYGEEVSETLVQLFKKYPLKLQYYKDYVPAKRGLPIECFESYILHDEVNKRFILLFTVYEHLPTKDSTLEFRSLHWQKDNSNWITKKL